MKKPKLSFWQIWNMSFGFLGIQFGFALQNGNVSRIFQTLGAEVEQIPILWIDVGMLWIMKQPALFSMWIYTLPAVTKLLYGSTDTTSVANSEGANKVSGIGLGVYPCHALCYTDRFWQPLYSSCL